MFIWQIDIMICKNYNTLGDTFTYNNILDDTVYR